MPFAAALSEHPLADPCHRRGGGRRARAARPEPDLAVALRHRRRTSARSTTSPPRSAPRCAPARSSAPPRCRSSAARREVEEQAAVALWAGRLGAGRPPCASRPDRVERRDGGDGRSSGSTEPTVEAAGDARAARRPVLVPGRRASSTPLAAQAPGLAVVGGLASAAAARAATGSCSTTRVHDRRRGRRAAAGPASPVDAPSCRQGCRPIGEPLTVTRAERNVHLRARRAAGARPAATSRRRRSTPSDRAAGRAGPARRAGDRRAQGSTSAAATS